MKYLHLHGLYESRDVLKYHVFNVMYTFNRFKWNLLELTDLGETLKFK